jgi:inhibitor of cysteine peptidase
MMKSIFKEPSKMKAKLILMCTAVSVSLCLLACAPTPKQEAVNVSCDDFTQAHFMSEALEVTAGESFTVTLCSNPTTGFQWSAAQISQQAVIEQTDHQFTPPSYQDGSPPAPGSPGQEVWTFKALKPGESTISMEYDQPWEGGMKSAWTFALTVVVK